MNFLILYNIQCLIIIWFLLFNVDVICTDVWFMCVSVSMVESEYVALYCKKNVCILLLHDESFPYVLLCSKFHIVGYGRAAWILKCTAY